MRILSKYSNFFLLIMFGIVISCGKDNIDSGKDVDIVLSAENLSIDWEGGERTISVNSDYDWHLLPLDEDWIEVNREGDSRIILVADRNETRSDRVIIVPIICNATRYSITVRQNAKSYIEIKGDRSIVVEAGGGQIECEVESNTLYEISVSSDWILLAMGGGGDILSGLKGGLGSQNTRTILLNVIANEYAETRSAKVYFNALNSDVKDSVEVVQNPVSQTGGSEIIDGVSYKLQESEYDKLNLVVMGDGFLKSHLAAGGLYETSTKQAIEAFFSIPPYSYYRELFNVYLVGVESETDVIGNKTGFGSSPRTRLGTAFGSGTEIVCDDDAVFEYASRAVDFSGARTALIIVVLNSDKYAGTCYMYINGNAIALCPMSKENPPYDFESVVRHEAGGHGFGFLADEYVYYQSQLPSNEVQEIKEWQEYGYQLNLDFTSDLSRILWKDFIGLAGYQEVGAYEGGSLYQYGVWRSEENSCMNNNIPYYNIQSRWVIYRRIKQLAGLPYSVSEFLSMDKVTRSQQLRLAAPGLTSAPGMGDFVPLARPKMIRE
ncbi:MAG: M64 family metallopeptidase [Candidatus Cryptobacteroides sp.]